MTSYLSIQEGKLASHVLLETRVQLIRTFLYKKLHQQFREFLLLNVKYLLVSRISEEEWLKICALGESSAFVSAYMK